MFGKKERSTDNNPDRDIALQQCFAEYEAGEITMETAQEIRHLALRSFEVQKSGWRAVESALQLAFSPQGNETAAKDQ